MKDENKYPGELTINGTILGCQTENRSWKDKTTGQDRSMSVFSAFLQNDLGVVVLRSFNPSPSLTSLKTGDSVCFPVDSFSKENGLKVFVVRV